MPVHTIDSGRQCGRAPGLGLSAYSGRAQLAMARTRVCTSPHDSHLNVRSSGNAPSFGTTRASLISAPQTGQSIARLDWSLTSRHMEEAAASVTSGIVRISRRPDGAKPVQGSTETPKDVLRELLNEPVAVETIGPIGGPRVEDHAATVV